MSVGVGRLKNVVVPDEAARTSTLPLVRELTAALEAESVSYCHWKSNAFLDRSRSGENDLDLLVRRSDLDAFSGVLHGLGFKQATNPSRSVPATEDYYGYERASGRLVHVHAHYQLIVGDDLTKNYRIPIEAAFLDLTLRDREFRIPIAELELILLVIRLTLKHSTWDAVLARRAKVPVSAREELAFLRGRTDERAMGALLKEHLPFVEQEAFDAAMASLDSSATARVRASRRLIAQLAVCARRSRAADVRSKFWRRAVATVRARLPLAAPRKRLAGGGAIIALVGADGAGKSTCVDGLSSWLAKDFAVAKVHLGRPPRSGLTLVIDPLLKLVLGFALLRRRASRRASVDSALRSRALALYAVATARDRYLAYRRARRLSGNGTLVICDRFPLPQLALMDAPQVPRITRANGRSWLDRSLASREQRYYRALTPPDVLVVLRVDPEIAVTRKPDELPEFVRSRWREIWEVDWPTVPAHIVDASRSISEVLSEVKALVWSEL
jgi:thymidylate kinase